MRTTRRWVHAFADELSRRGVAPPGAQRSPSGTTPAACAQVRTGKTRFTTGHQATAAAFVAIVSPALSELAVVRARAHTCSRSVGSNADQVDRSGRVFKAVKTPWPDNSHRLVFCEPSRTSISSGMTTAGRREFSAGTRGNSSAPCASWPMASNLVLRKMRRGNQRVHVAWPVEECLTAWEQLSAELRTQGIRRPADRTAATRHSATSC